MPIRIRRALYLFFILLFFVISALTIGYARGFRYDPQSHTVRRTGLIILNSEPDGASVWINEKKSSEKTLAYIKNLPPGSHDVRIEKEGYLPWSKQLSVSEGSATIADSITLFREHPREETVVRGGSQFAFHPFAPSIVYVKGTDEKQIRRYHTALQSDILLFTTFGTIESMEYSVSGSALLVRLLENGKTNFVAIPFDAPQEAVSLNSLIDRPIINASWSLDSDDLLMLDIDEGSLAMTLSTRRMNPILPRTGDEQIRYLTSAGFLEYSNSHLSLITDGGQREALIPDLPADAIITGNTSGHLAISSPSRSMVFLFENLSKKPIRIEEIPTLAREMAWDESGNEIVLENNAEIQVYSLQTQKTETLGRYSEPFSRVQFFPNGSLIVFRRENGDIVATERDDRDHRNTFLLAKNAQDYTFARNGKRLYATVPDEDGTLLLQNFDIQ